MISFGIVEAARPPCICGSGASVGLAYHPERAVCCIGGDAGSVVGTVVAQVLGEHGEGEEEEEERGDVGSKDHGGGFDARSGEVGAEVLAITGDGWVWEIKSARGYANELVEGIAGSNTLNNSLRASK